MNYQKQLPVNLCWISTTQVVSLLSPYGSNRKMKMGELKQSKQIKQSQNLFTTNIIHVFGNLKGLV